MYALVSLADAWTADHYWTTHQTKCGHIYASRSLKVAGKHIKRLLHREIMQTPPGMIVDHLSPLGTLDNRREMLKNTTQRKNILRAHAPEAGIHQYANRWVATLGVNNVLGRFNSYEEALACRLEAYEAALHG